MKKFLVLLILSLALTIGASNAHADAYGGSIEQNDSDSGRGNDVLPIVGIILFFGTLVTVLLLIEKRENKKHDKAVEESNRIRDEIAKRDRDIEIAKHPYRYSHTSMFP